jgi:hypothetical protein
MGEPDILEEMEAVNGNAVDAAEGGDNASDGDALSPIPVAAANDAVRFSMNPIPSSSINSRTDAAD